MKINYSKLNALHGFTLKVLGKRCIHVSQNLRNKQNNLLDYLIGRIKATGPITVASYMKEALTNPIWGYYMKKDVFGEKGDFTTSPEISQIFGELLGIWIYAHWSQIGKPSNVQLVELGPGRGTLMSDIARVLVQLDRKSMANYSIHLVEVSEKMIEIQRKHLLGTQSKENELAVHWYPHIDDVPKGLSFFIAHEFFDALPVHLFRRTEKGWREVLINYSREKEMLEYVIAPGPNSLTSSFIDKSFTTDECEICPDGAVIVSKISERIENFGGGALIIDYGELKSDRHSLRGFKNHMLVDDILIDPGSFDITSNVDFSFLKRYGGREKVKFHGPLTQSEFLHRMGIRERVQSLMSRSTEKQVKNLMSSYEYLCSPQKMGKKFKVMAITNKGDPNPPSI